MPTKSENLYSLEEKKQFYRDYLDDVKLMQLATSYDNQPWLCNVWYVRDPQDNIYFISRETRRHSIEIEKNPKVSCTFHKWFERGLGEQGQALVIAGKAKKMTGNEIEKPYTLYQERYPNLENFQSLDDFVNGTGHHFFYKITPKQIVWWDEKNFDNPRQEIETS